MAHAVQNIHGAIMVDTEWADITIDTITSASSMDHAGVGGFAFAPSWRTRSAWALHVLKSITGGMHTTFAQLAASAVLAELRSAGRPLPEHRRPKYNFGRTTENKVNRSRRTRAAAPFSRPLFARPAAPRPESRTTDAEENVAWHSLSSPERR